MPLPFVSIIIIGHNEAAMLGQAIQSALDVDYPGDRFEVIYVDSNSTDDSLDIAASFPIRVVALEEGLPTPGAARNAGARVARGEYLHFQDGDMLLDPNWLKVALTVLNADTVGCVFGRVREMNPHKNIFNRTEDIHLALQAPGPSRSPAGGGTFTREAFQSAGGYDGALRAGEEIDLGYRLRRRGYRILSLNYPMARHDVDFKGFSYFWRRGIRDGVSETEILRRCRNRREVLSRSYIWKTDAQMLLFVGGTATSVALGVYAAVPVVLMMPGLLIARKTWQYYRRLGDLKSSFIGAFFLYFYKLPMFLGHVKQLLKVGFETIKGRGRTSRLNRLTECL